MEQNQNKVKPLTLWGFLMSQYCHPVMFFFSQSRMNPCEIEFIAVLFRLLSEMKSHLTLSMMMQVLKIVLNLHIGPL